MIDRKAVIAEALSWDGTPYHPQQSCKGAGVDCGGLIYGVLKAVGLLPSGYRPPRMSPQWYMHRTDEIIVSELQRFGWQVTREPQPGDVLTMQFGRAESHAAFVLPRGRMIHADAQAATTHISLIERYSGRVRHAWTHLELSPWQD